MHKKKKVLIASNWCQLPTGFGGFARKLLEHLYKTGKYDLVHYAAGVGFQNPEFQKWPWRSYGALPNDPAEIQRLNSDQNQMRLASYGSYNIDKVLQLEKPDLCSFHEDIWGVDYILNSKYYDKFHTIIHTTLDSLPLLPTAVNNAPKFKNYYVWSSFAEKEFKRLALVERNILSKEQRLFAGQPFPSPEQFQQEKVKFDAHVKVREDRIEAFNRVKTLGGIVDTDSYKKLPDHERVSLRKKQGLESFFCIGYVFRSQLRKLIPNLLEGFKLFQDQNPQIKNVKILTFCSWSEGWNIPDLINELGLNPADVLATYKCSVTSEFFILPFSGENIKNPNTGENTLSTVGIGNKLTNEQLNQWYNCLDGYAHLITSGGFEVPVFEAKMAELVTIVSDYSCAEDYCVPEAQSMIVDSSFYREIGTNFKKSSPLPSSIAKNIRKLYETPLEKRREMGKKAREWVLSNYSVEVIGKKFEDIIDALPVLDVSWDIEVIPKNPNFPNPNIQDNVEWLKCIYKNILLMDIVDMNDSGLQYWLSCIAKGMPRENIYKYFIDTANQENQKLPQKQTSLSDLIDKNGRKTLCLVAPESLGDIFYCTCLLDSFKEKYPNCDIYFVTKPENFELLEGNPNIYKLLPYSPAFDSEINITGCGQHNGYFDYFCFLTVSTQRFLNYLTQKHQSVS